MSGQLLGTSSQYSAAASARHMTHKQHLGLCGLISLIFLEVAGGPFGTEVWHPLLSRLCILLKTLYGSCQKAIIVCL